MRQGVGRSRRGTAPARSHPVLSEVGAEAARAENAASTRSLTYAAFCSAEHPATQSEAQANADGGATPISTAAHAAANAPRIVLRTTERKARFLLVKQRSRAKPRSCWHSTR